MAEKEYIDLEEAVATLKRNSLKCFNSYYKGYVNAIEDLADIPTADVAPVVRCKDCKWRPLCCRTIRTGGNKPDDFCSFGERKDG